MQAACRHRMHSSRSEQTGPPIVQTVANGKNFLEEFWEEVRTRYVSLVSAAAGSPTS